MSRFQWGRRLSVSAAEYAQKAPYLVLGDALRDTLDPRLRGA